MAHQVTIQRRDGRREQATVRTRPGSFCKLQRPGAIRHHRTRPGPLLVLATGPIVARAANTLGIVVIEAEPELAGRLRVEGYTVAA